MKALLLPFLTVPGIILCALGVLMVFGYHLRRRTFMVVLAVILVCGWIVSTTAFGRLLASVLIAQVDGASMDVKPEDVDLIVVLGADIIYTGQTGWLPSQESYRRAAVAYELQSRIGSRVPVLISGGHIYGVQYPSEAEVIKTYFDRHDARVRPTILEEFSTSTYENSLQTSFIIQERQARDIFLVTSEIHMWRALATFRARGINALPFPAITAPRGGLGLRGYLPTPEGALLTSKAMYEIYGLATYLITGKIKMEDL